MRTTDCPCSRSDGLPVRAFGHDILSDTHGAKHTMTPPSRRSRKKHNSTQTPSSRMNPEMATAVTLKETAWEGIRRAHAGAQHTSSGHLVALRGLSMGWLGGMALVVCHTRDGHRLTVTNLSFVDLILDENRTKLHLHRYTRWAAYSSSCGFHIREQ